MAVAPIQPLAWELPYAAGVAVKKKKKKKSDLPKLKVGQNELLNSQDLQFFSLVKCW